METVVKFPNELNRLFDDAHRAIAMGTESKQKFVEGKLLLSASLAAIRTKFKDNEAFGKSCSEHGLGENIVSRNDRYILIEWAERPEWTRTVLEKTERTSVRTIHEKEWRTTLHSPVQSPQRVNKAEEAAKAIKAETGKWPDRKTLVEVSGIAPRNVDNALRTVKAVEAAQVAPTEITFTKAQEYHIEACIKVLDMKREKTFEARVTAKNQEEIAKLFPRLQEMQDQAALNEKTYRELVAKMAVLTKAEYVDILFCVHNEHVEADRRQRAGIALIAKKFKLTGEK